MFRFGLKKEEKDMISFTLSELKELRAELSGLRDALARMTPGEQPGGQAEALLGTFLQLPQSHAHKEEVCPLSLKAEPAQPAPELAGGGPGVECGPEGDVSSLAGAFPADGSAVEECAEAPGGEFRKEAAASRDWAVVNLAAARRPWWKFWEPANRVTKRSI